MGAATAVPVLEGAPLWAQVLYGILALLVTAFLLPYLKRRIDAAKAARTKDDLTARQILGNELRQFMLERAECYAERRFLPLAQNILAGKLKDKHAIKKELRSWGDDLKLEAMAYFDKQGLNLLATVGDQWLDVMIERAANRVSPFPGKDTAVELLKKKYSNMIVAKGVEYVRGRFLADEPEAPEEPAPAHADEG